MSYSVIHLTNEPFTNTKPTDYHQFKYDLDNFQLHGCKAIDNNENVLITAHTGSGKTVLALYAIARCFALGKKVIYTSPIKTLSNQKFKEQIEYLNKLVLDYCVPNVMSEVEQYLGYLDNVQKLPNPLPLPENLSSAGTKTLRSVTTTF